MLQNIQKQHSSLPNCLQSVPVNIYPKLTNLQVIPRFFYKLHPDKVGLNVAIYIIVNIAGATLSSFLLQQAWFSQMSKHVDVGLDFRVELQGFLNWN